MENKFFRWNELVDFDDESITFGDCTLLMDIGKYKKNEVIIQIRIDNVRGHMEFWDAEKCLAKFQLEYTLVKELD